VDEFMSRLNPWGKKICETISNQKADLSDVTRVLLDMKGELGNGPVLHAIDALNTTTAINRNAVTALSLLIQCAPTSRLPFRWTHQEEPVVKCREFDLQGNLTIICLAGLQFDEAWTRLLEKGGWSAPTYKTYEEFWKLLQERGGWWDPLYDFGEWNRIFQTPSKKFEFYAQGLSRLASPSVLKRW
jgi:hypothetical protein